jgi:hypothetical protein
MSKIKPQTPSKLSLATAPVIHSSLDAIIPEKIKLSGANRRRVKTVSLKNKDIDRLEILLRNIQNTQQKKISSSDIIKGLLILGESIATEELLSYVQQSMIE